MTECNYHETRYIYIYIYIYIYPNLKSVSLCAVPLNDQKQFRLNEINEIKDYFVVEIKERELLSKRLSKNIASLTILINH